MGSGGRMPALMNVRTWFIVFVLAGVLISRAAAAPAVQAQGAFAHGTVVALRGTPHLWIADRQGVLHWAGDTRALADKYVRWGRESRVEVTLEQLRRLSRGDPWLSAGLLKDGDPIYLVKWENDWSEPRLLHIQSIGDVELFGITGSNYGSFVLDRPTWEARFGRSVAGLQRSALDVVTMPRALPALAPLSGRPLAALKIVLDPGHGGSDLGAVHHGQREAAVNLAIAEALRPHLEQLGASVLLTRDADNGVLPPHVLERDELQARADIANRAGADLFVSIHADASEDPRLAGALTFFGPERGYPIIAGRSPRLVAQSRLFARAMQRELVAATGQINLGVQSARFWTIGAAQMPAVLVEVGFLTNTGDARRLAQAAFRQRIAEGIARGIVAYVQSADDAIFVNDLTIPDGTPLRPGQSFTKTWLLRNVGKQTWSREYRLTYRSGGEWGTVSSVRLPHPVAAGHEVAVSVAMIAPKALATNRAAWQLQDPDGKWFGDPVWAQIALGDGSRPTDRAAPIGGPAFSYFDETGHNVSFAFRRFFEAHGGVNTFGYPRTEELTEDGRTVQYFQHARFEYHAEHAGTEREVQLAPLGTLLTRPQRPFPTGEPFESGPDRRFFPETGHGVHFAFLKFFEAHGGVAMFGYPISGERQEADHYRAGRIRTVQYFERARLEYYPGTRRHPAGGTAGAAGRRATVAARLAAGNNAPAAMAILGL